MSSIVISNPQIKRLLVGKVDEEIMIAVLEGNQLVELHLEEIDNESMTGNIYLGKVETLVAGLDAAFVNIGKSKNAFLRYKDVIKLPKGKKNEPEKEESIVKGQKVIVQVKKDPIGSKGAQVTGNVGIAGRYLVYLPFSKTIGVSKKIENPYERRRLHDFMIKSCPGEGVIVRTVAKNAELAVLGNELNELKKEWEEINKKFIRFKKPREIYSEPDILEQIMREKYDNTVDEIISSDLEIHSRLQIILDTFNNKAVQGKLRLSKDDVFEVYNVNAQLEDIYKRKISIECGGSLVIDRTEAFSIIDINSGSNTINRNSRDMALETNVQAAREVARQIRLRNLSGIIIVDFIDMEEENDRSTVLKVMEEEFKKDKAKTSIMGFTRLGLLEITRKRTSPPLEEMLFDLCPVCRGEGLVVSPKRLIKLLSTEIRHAVEIKDVKEIDISVHWGLSGFLSKEWREEFEILSGKKLNVDFSRRDPNGYDIKFKK